MSTRKSKIRTLARTSLVSLLSGALGRKNFALLSRSLWMSSRLDMPNESAVNGETVLRDTLRTHHRGENNREVLDIGANIGQWSTFFLDGLTQQERNALRMHVFEPSPASFEALKTNLARIPPPRELIYNQMAVSNSAGSVSFSILSPLSQVNSIIPLDKAKPATTITVPCTTVNEYCKAQSIAQVFFLKIDTEGNDFKVLEGAAELMKNNSIDYIQFEYNHRWIAFRCFLRDVFEMLEGLPYRLGKLTPQGVEFYNQWHPELERFLEGNYLICKTKHCDRLPKTTWWNA